MNLLFQHFYLKTWKFHKAHMNILHIYIYLHILKYIDEFIKYTKETYEEVTWKRKEALVLETRAHH